MATAAQRAKPQEVRDRVKDGNAYLVCAYDDESKCKEMRLEGALTRQEFEGKLSSVSKSTPIFFY